MRSNQQTERALRSAHQEQERCGSGRALEALWEAGVHFSPPAPGCPADNTQMLRQRKPYDEATL